MLTLTSEQVRPLSLWLPVGVGHEKEAGPLIVVRESLSLCSGPQPLSPGLLTAP